MTKSHWGRRIEGEYEVYYTLCGDHVGLDRIGKTTQDVTCKICIRCLNKQAAQAVRTPGPVAFDMPESASELPVMTRKTYKRRHCRCGRCELCLYYKHVKISAATAPYRDSAHRLHSEYVWQSAEGAMTWYAEYMAEGVSPVGFSQVVARIGRAGTSVQSVSDGQESPWARSAFLAVSMEKALYQAYADINRCGLRRSQCLDILLSRAVGVPNRNKSGRIERIPLPGKILAERYSVKINDIGIVSKGGRQRVYEYLREKKLVPQKRSHR